MGIAKAVPIFFCRFLKIDLTIRQKSDPENALWVRGLMNLGSWAHEPKLVGPRT